jgi:hypothetical protein
MRLIFHIACLGGEITFLKVVKCDCFSFTFFYGVSFKTCSGHCSLIQLGCSSARSVSPDIRDRSRGISTPCRYVLTSRAVHLNAWFEVMLDPWFRRPPVLTELLNDLDVGVVERPTLFRYDTSHLDRC